MVRSCSGFERIDGSQLGLRVAGLVQHHAIFTLPRRTDSLILRQPCFHHINSNYLPIPNKTEYLNNKDTSNCHRLRSISNYYSNQNECYQNF